jgi:hypothetical protein
MKVSVLVMCVFLLAMTAVVAGASDINFGSYARSVAMGGAGLALIDDASTSSIINPAAAAAVGTKFQFVFPSMDVHTRGATFNDVTDRTSELFSGESDDAWKLLQDFGEEQTTINVGFVTGFTGAFGITAEGEGQALITPSATFSEWCRAGLPTTAAELQAAVEDNSITDTTVVNAINTALADSTINGTDAADIANAFMGDTKIVGRFVYSLPAINLSRGFDAKSGKLWLGTRMRWLNSETHTWYVDQDDSTTDEIDIEADEDESQYYEDSGLGADVGFIYQPKGKLLQYGMVINNFLDAKLKGIDTPRMVSIGVASQPNDRWKFAADLVNINKAYDESTKLRMGAEFSVAKNLALRAGYSGDAFTYGVGFMGLNVAFSDDAPNMISRVLRF